MQAVILAGGRGTRLKPYTLVFPKPMLPVGGVPIIETIVRQLAYFGFDDLVISLGYLGEYIRIFFQDETNVPENTRIRYSYEDSPLGTAGPVATIDNLEEDFLVINGDILTTIDYRKFYEFHRASGCALSVAVGVREVNLSLGILDIDESGTIKDFREKPKYTFHDNMGIYIYNKRVLRYIERNQRLDLNDLVLRLIQQGETVKGYISEEEYFWIDIGQHGEYERANEQFEKRKSDFLKL